MIKVQKSNRDRPKDMLSRANKERLANTRLIKAGKKDKVSFSVYSETVVKDALIKVFHNKCAYCEYDISGGAPWEIEHFRPKSRRMLKKDKTPKYIGYYWLAADWNNLLLACLDCNRPRKHNIPGRTTKITIGKSDQFPLNDEAKRCTSPNGTRLTNEDRVRLLINPCKEDGEIYFEFDTNPNGAAPGNIMAKTSLKGLALQRALRSIEVYALHRIGIVDKRREHMGELRKKMNVIIVGMRDYDNLPKKFKSDKKDQVIEYMKELLSYRNKERQFAAVSRQMVKDFLKQTSKDLKRITGKRFV